MTDATPVTDDDVARFRRDGFLVKRGLLGPRASTLSDWTDEVLAWPEQPGRHMVYYEDSSIEPGARVVQRIENFDPYHPGFHTLFSEGPLIDAVGRLFGEPALLFKDKINFKMPGGDGFKPHQDAQAGWQVYADLFISVLVSIDRATIENGCLELVAGFNGHGLVGDEWRPLDGDQMAGMNFQPYPTEPGDVVFFDSYAPHQSAPNRTGRPRRALYVTYNTAAAGDHRAQYYADKRRSFPPDIEREPGKTYVFRV